MNEWEKHKKRFPTKFALSPDEEEHCHVNFTEAFAVFHKGERFVFACWLHKPIWTRGPGLPWYYADDNEEISDAALRAGFPNGTLIDLLDVKKGTGSFQDKAVRWNPEKHIWVYLNNRTVHFNDTSASQTPAEDDDTAKVEELLEQTRTRLTLAAQKLSSRASTPQESPVSRGKSPAPQQSQVPTPPVSKGKQPALLPQSTPGPSGITRSPSPLSPVPSPSRSPSPVTAPAMAQNQPTRPIGATPEPYDGSGKNAISF